MRHLIRRPSLRLQARPLPACIGIDVSILLDKGQRGLLVGQTGSGKTQNALWQLRHTPIWPVIIFDTKIEPEFLTLADGDEKLQLIDGFEEYTQHSKLRRSERPDFAVVRPSIDEMGDVDAMDGYVRLAYEKFGPGLFYFDEVYNWHNRGAAGNGLIGLLTRGRSKGKTVLMATQRPSWISRFCVTESQKFYLHWLADSRDKKTLAEVVPNFDKLPDVPKHHFYHYSTTDHETAPRLYLPVPQHVPGSAPESRSRGWL